MIKEKLITKSTNEKETIQQLIDLLIKKCESDEQLKQAILNADKKTIDTCWDFIKMTIKQKAKNGSYCATDEEVLGIAIHYFTDENIVVEEPKKIEKVEHKDIKKEIKQEIKVKQEQKTKKSSNNEQLSLFDFGFEM